MAGDLLATIQEDLKSALKESNHETLRTLRYLLSEINNLAIDKYPPAFASANGGASAGKPEKTGLTDEDITSVIQKLIKTHKESIEAFKSGDRQDLVEKEKAELDILQKYLPEQLNEEEIRKIIEEIKASGLTDFGQIMSQVMPKVKGRTDGATVAKIVKDSLPKV